MLQPGSLKREIALGGFTNRREMGCNVGQDDFFHSRSVRLNRESRLNEHYLTMTGGEFYAVRCED